MGPTLAFDYPPRPWERYPLGGNGSEGATGADDVTIAVLDTRAPTIALKVFDRILWPPDGQLHLVAKVHATDACDADATLTVTVSSNQPSNEHGHRDPDWRVVKRDGVLWVWVRAERDGGKKGERVYAITATATDGSGNVATANETVTVSHDRRDGQRPHDDDGHREDDHRRS